MGQKIGNFLNDRQIFRHNFSFLKEVFLSSMYLSNVTSFFGQNFLFLKELSFQFHVFGPKLLIFLASSK